MAIEIEKAIEEALATVCGTIALAGGATLAVRAFLKDDAPEEDAEELAYPCVVIAAGTAQRWAEQDEMLWEAPVQVMCATHYTDDPKRTVLSDLTARVSEKLHYENWGAIDAALPYNVSLAGLEVGTAPPELDERTQAENFSVKALLVVDSAATSTAAA